MKNFNLLKLSCAAAILSVSGMAQAQQQKILSFDNNPYASFVGERVMVTSPANLSKNLVYTITNDGSGATGEWGKAIQAIYNSQIVKAAPYNACGALTNGSAISGKIALVERGNCEFGAKAKAAQDAGASAVIIVNNIDGGPIGMGAGAVGAQVTIPVLMISKEEGAAISTALDNSTTVNMVITKWGNNLSHDLGILNSGTSKWHNYAIPGNQMVTASTQDPYKAIDGVVIANFGNSTETNVKMKATVKFTPEGSTTAQTIKEHTSTSITSFPTIDSIRSLFIDETYGLKDSKENGRYDVTYEVSSDATDEFPGDNSVTYSFYTNTRVYSKSRYDFTKNEPVASVSFGWASGVANYIRGPLYYVAKGGYKVESLQGSVSTGSATNNKLNTIAGGSFNLLIWKWVDGSNSQAKDSIMQQAETEIVGEASYTFDNDDTSGQTFTLPVIKAGGSGTEPMVTDNNTWYWVTAVMPGTAYLGSDGVLNYYPRSFARAHASAPFIEPYTITFRGDMNEWQAQAGMQPDMFPSGPTASVDVDSVLYSQEKRGILPAIAMITSQFPVSVKDLEASSASIREVSIYPNPAKESFTVKVNFTEQSANVGFKIVDAAGRLVMVDAQPNTGANSTYVINTKDLAVGNYYLLVTVGNQMRTQKFSVIK